MRQALAGMLWSKQFYYFDGDQWLGEHHAHPLQPGSGNSRNRDLFHMFNRDVISMPDKWEYPWFAAWDLAFQAIALALIDPEFAKAVGLPQNILHGLWSMAQVARGVAQLAGGDPRALKRLSVQFRGLGIPEQEIAVSGTIREVDGHRVAVEVIAEQSGNAIIRNAEAELEL